MIVETIVLILTGLILWTIKLSLERKWKNLPPGPLQLPGVGNLHQMFWKVSQGKPPYIIFKDFATEYGPVTSIQFGWMNQVVVDDPDMIKQVLTSEVWTDRPFDVSIGTRSFDKPYGILFSSGDEWKEMRRFALRTLRDFGFGKHKDQESVLQEEVQELMSRVDAKIDKGVAGDRVAQLEVEQLFTISVLNIVWALVAGVRFAQDDPGLLAINGRGSQVLREIPVGVDILSAFPFAAFRDFVLKNTKRGRIIKDFLDQMHNFFRKILEERRTQGFYKDDQRDFIDIFLKEIENHKSAEQSGPNYYTDEQFLTVILDLFRAGSETTSNTLEFGFLYMILNPDVQKKVQKEIDRVVGRSRPPSYASDRIQMPYTEATISEIQRMANVVPVDIRVPREDTTLGGRFIRKGTSGILNLHSSHFNPNVWDDPHVFNPNRFLDSENNLINTQKLVQFGGGKRMCLGESVARSSLFTFFATFLQKYSFETVPGQPAPTSEPRSGFTQSPHPFEACIRYR